tara:strand:- start:1706 stop:1945 length:240 start_codon:yes stop_codon:yes gene_type:complete
MFEPGDFELPLEKKLKLRIILDEVDHCDDKDTLRESLKSCAQQLLQYQHMLGKAVEKNLINMVSEIDDKIGEILRDTNA